MFDLSSKLQNGINDPNGLENKIYNMMKGRKTFNLAIQPQSLAVVKFNMLYKMLSFGSKDYTV